MSNLDNCQSNQHTRYVVQRAAALAALLCAFLFPNNTRAETFLVPQEIITIQGAIDLAAPGDTVLVAPGSYRGNGNKNLDFYGKDIALIGELGSGSTIIDCEGDGRGLSLTSNESPAALIQGLSIINGAALEGSAIGETGGGVYITTASATFVDVSVRNCTAKYTGGIAIVLGGSPHLENCTIEENVSLSGDGGGLTICNGSEAVLSNVTISNNESSSYGGGVHICYSDPEFHSVHFISNSSSSFGGGVWVGGASSAVFTSCTFFQNVSGTGGGGLCLNAETSSVLDCIFIENTASELGGAIRVSSDHGSSITGCFFYLNSAGAGGAIYLGEFSSHPNTSITNCTLLRNAAVWGAGSAICANWQAEADVSNSLIVENQDGTALWSDHGAGLYLSCSNVWGNPSGGYGGDLADQTGTNGNISVDPLLCEPDSSSYVADISPCLPDNNSCGVLIGAFGEGCTLTGLPNGATPSAFALEQNHPNPFNPRTNISFTLPEPARVHLRIFDPSGCLIRTLLDGEFYPAGLHNAVWRGKNDQGKPVASGIYFYSVEAGQYHDTKRMILLR